MAELVGAFDVAGVDGADSEDAYVVPYSHQATVISREADGRVEVVRKTENYVFKTLKTVPRTGVLIVGLGGNNGTTLTAGVLANRKACVWETRRGSQAANWYGSLTQCTASPLGCDASGRQIVCAFKDLVPMVNPNDMIVGGWDISGADMYEAARRSHVLEPALLSQLEGELRAMKPMPGAFDLSFVAPNQKERADNVIPGTKSDVVRQLRSDIQNFKRQNDLKTVIVLWSANTERYAKVMAGVNDTSGNLLRAVEGNHPEVAPSTLYALAALQEGCPFINGSPQNTFVPGLIEYAIFVKGLIAGDDFKTGQTKFKSVVSDFLVSSGMRLSSIVSYNHLGNNDGLNLSHEQCFKSKQISKASVVDDICDGNPLLYAPGGRPDHVVVIKYVPAVGDSKRALDEYETEIFLGGRNTISVHNTCEDSLLAAPLMMDLVVLTELFTRIFVKREGDPDFERFHTLLAALSFLLKAPQVPPTARVVNALFPQRQCLENILRACRGLPPVDNTRIGELLYPASE